MRDCLKRGEAPLASHLLYTQRGILKEELPEERALGIKAGFAWCSVADATVVYADRGISPGMKLGIKDALEHDRMIEYRVLEEEAVVRITQEANG